MGEETEYQGLAQGRGACVGAEPHMACSSCPVYAGSYENNLLYFGHWPKLENLKCMDQILRSQRKEHSQHQTHNALCEASMWQIYAQCMNEWVIQVIA